MSTGQVVSAPLTMTPKVVYLCASVLLHFTFQVECTSSHVNNAPILGVLLQDTQDKSEQFIGASYVKYLESSGARVVPIFVNQPASYYHDLVKHLNGVLLPGGGSSLTSSAYAQAADVLLQSAIELNDNGTHFPVWGTCLGFQKLILYFVGDNRWLSHCEVENVALNLDIEDGVEEDCRLFNDTESAPYAVLILQILRNNAVTANYHKYCLNVTEYQTNSKISSQFALVSSNTYGDSTFVSMVEHRKYPFYGSAWHPEKNQFEFVVTAHKGNISHDWNAIQVGQYFANFLVNEARKNKNHFKNKLAESEQLIYNFNAYRVYTGQYSNATFEEEYRFPAHFSGNGQLGLPVSTHSIMLITTWMFYLSLVS